MPAPMIHLTVAHELAITEKLNDFPQFYLGVLAPDSFHSRKENYFENRKTSHLTADDKFACQDNIIKFMEQHKYNSQKWFYIGYGVHLLTDIYWEEMIYNPFLLAYSKNKDTSYSNPHDAYTADLPMLDLWMYRNCEYKDDLWKYIFQGHSFDVEGLVTAAEIDIERDYTLAWYDEKKDRIINDFKYITLNQVTDFIQKSTKDIDSKLSPLML